ncbi:MAG: hypothetical protein QME74_02455 [Candidatus Edwardsbacteria bacterium]|nr:hypothetical protein [Candidatus Edwardsbacteria bacterium]
MSKKMFTILMTAVVCCLAAATAIAQAKFTEFPIAAGKDSTFSVGAVWGGTSGTGIVAIIGDTLSQYNITAQMVSPPNNLIGNRISIGRSGTFPGPVVKFDGTNYLMGWIENNGDINGQFISPAGTLTYFTIGTNASIERPGNGNLCFGDTTYLAVFVKTDTCLYGQLVSKSGNLIGGQI